MNNKRKHEKMQNKYAIKCQANLSVTYNYIINKNKTVSKCTRVARYKFEDVHYCTEHAGMRLLDDAMLENKIKKL